MLSVGKGRVWEAEWSKCPSKFRVGEGIVRSKQFASAEPQRHVFPFREALSQQQYSFNFPETLIKRRQRRKCRKHAEKEISSSTMGVIDQICFPGASELLHRTNGTVVKVLASLSSDLTDIAKIIQVYYQHQQ